jgi:hypothetical protein
MTYYLCSLKSMSAEDLLIGENDSRDVKQHLKVCLLHKLPYVNIKDRNAPFKGVSRCTSETKVKGVRCNQLF